MATQNIIILLSLLALTTHVHSQFYDIFEGFQPFLQTVQPIRRPGLYPQNNGQRKPETSHITSDERPSSRDQNNGDIYNRPNSKPKRKQTTIDQLFNFNILTTPKPVRKSTINSSHRNNSPKANTRENSNSRNHQTNTKELNTNNGIRSWYDDSANNINADLSTTKPPRTTTKRIYDTNRNYYNDNQRSNYGNNYYTTSNPLYNRPGVKPAVIVSNLPPITNKPVNNGPYGVYQRTTEAGAIRFPEEPDINPEEIKGPDEDKMSSTEKRRYIEISEKMCDQYKALSVKNIEAIPLVPSPEPIHVNVSTCPATNVPLVVGGKVVTIEEFPHMALLGWTKVPDGGYAWKCGGSLVSNQYVLTAGHCSYQEKDDTVSIGAPRVVKLGSTYVDDRRAVVVKVMMVIKHPKYVPNRSYYDIALLKLVKTVTFSDVIRPACLGVPPRVGEPIIATGWGRTEFGGSQSKELRGVSIPIWDLDECRRVLGTTWKLPQGPSRDSQVCAGDKNGGKDTCQGDSGGPAQVQDGCSWRIVAVTSVGRSCGAPNTPALYATLHRAFISAQIFGETSKNNNNPYNNDVSIRKNYPTNNENQNNNSNENNYDSNQNSNSNSNNHNQYDPWTDSVKFNKNTGNRNNNRQDTNNGNWNSDSINSSPKIYENNPSSTNTRNENRYNNNYNGRSESNINLETNNARRVSNYNRQYQDSYATNTENGGQRSNYENGYNNQRNGNNNYEITFYRPSDYAITEAPRRSPGWWSSYDYK